METHVKIKELYMNGAESIKYCRKISETILHRVVNVKREN